MAYGVQPYDPSKPITPPKPSNPMVNSYGAPLQPPPTTGTIGPKITPSQTSIQPPPTTSTIGPNVSTLNATNSSVSPALGYGGANYGNASDAVRQSIASNENKLNTDPAFVKSEYDRTNQVIESRKAQGLDITEQNNYLQGLNGRISKMDPVAKPVIAPPPTTQSKDYSQIMDSVRNNYMRDLQDKTSSIEQQLQQAIQASNLAVNQNNGQLQERVKQLQDMKAQNDDDILQFNNRFGGAYSGGTAYQRGVNADASTRAVSGATRDVDMRNQDIWGRNAVLAQQAAESIQQLKGAAPDRIRELIRQAVNDERSFGLQEGQLTGNYNGTPTLAAQQFGLQNKEANWNAYKDSVGMTGNLGGGPMSDWGNLGGTSGSPSYQAQQDALKNSAAYTGYIPDGKGGMMRTTAEEQRQLGNLWAVADQTGTIPDQLATIYGIPKGTQTQKAKEAAMTNSRLTDQYQSNIDKSLYGILDKQSNSDKGPTVSDISQNIGRALTQNGDNLDLSNPDTKEKVEAMIVTQTQDPLVAVPLYNMYQIPVPEQLKQEYAEALKKVVP